MPSAPPTCCDVLMRPEAMPASWGWTPWRAAIETGTNAKPRPMPARTKPGTRSTRYPPCTSICVNQSRPSVSSDMPIVRIVLTPKRVTRACEAPAAKMITTATSRYAKPDFSAE